MRPGGWGLIYGFVVDRVNVSVLAYVPVRSASFASMCWLNATVAASWLTGASHVFTVAGSGDPPASSGEGSEYATLLPHAPAPATGCVSPSAHGGPFVRWPGAVVLG